MHFILYQTTNQINGKKYIGKHVTEDLDDGYLGSGLVLSKAIKKYGRDAFKRETLIVCDNEEELTQKEKEYVTLDIVLDDMYYNIALGGYGGAIVLKPEHPLYDATRKKISESQKAISNLKSEITKENHRLHKVGMYGKKQTDKQKEAVAAAARNRIRTPEEIAKMKQSYFNTINQVGYVHPHTGKARSDAVKQAIRDKKKCEPLKECIHCGKKMNAGNLARYHGNKCKQKMN